MKELMEAKKDCKEKSLKAREAIIESQNSIKNLKIIAWRHFNSFKDFVLENKELYEGFDIKNINKVNSNIKNVSFSNSKKALRVVFERLNMPNGTEIVVLIPYGFLEDENEFLKQRKEYLESKQIKKNEIKINELIEKRNSLNQKIKEINLSIIALEKIQQC